MPVSGTATASGNFRTGNVGGVAGWGVFNLCGVAASDTHAYVLTTNTVNPNINGGASECHLFRTPWATWTVAATELLSSFTRASGSISPSNALCRRPADGLIAAQHANDNLWTFDPASAYARTDHGATGIGSPSAELMGLAFDPTDDGVLWMVQLNGGPRRFRLGTGDLGAIDWQVPMYSLSLSPTGVFVGAASWDTSNNPKGVVVLDPATGLKRFPFGLRWLSADRDGAGNGNTTETVLANRAAISSCRDACMDLDGVIYAASNSAAATGLRRVSADWTTVDSISMGGAGNPGSRGRCAVSPDGTKVAVSIGEQLVRVT